MAPRETGPRDGRRVEGWAWRHRAHARTSASALIFCAELFVPSADLQAIHMKRLGARHPMIAGKMTTGRSAPAASAMRRSEEHTSELQSLAYLVCRLLLEKKKKRIDDIYYSKKST